MDDKYIDIHKDKNDAMNSKLWEISSAVNRMNQTINEMSKDLNTQKIHIDNLKSFKANVENNLNSFMKTQERCNVRSPIFDALANDVKQLHKDIQKLASEHASIYATLNEIPLKYESISRPIKMLDVIKLGPAIITVIVAIGYFLFYLFKHFNLHLG